MLNKNLFKAGLLGLSLMSAGNVFAVSFTNGKLNSCYGPIAIPCVVVAAAGLVTKFLPLKEAKKVAADIAEGNTEVKLSKAQRAALFFDSKVRTIGACVFGTIGVATSFMWIKNKKYNDADAAIAAHDAYVKLPDGDDKGTDTEKAEATAKAAAKAKIDKLFPNGAADLAEADKLKADLKDLW